MNGTPPRTRQSRLREIANELCELVQQQIDDLQQGIGEDDLQGYLDRRGQISELQTQLLNLRRLPS